MSRLIRHNLLVNSQHPQNLPAQSALGEPSAPPRIHQGYQGWTPNNVYEMHAYRPQLSGDPRPAKLPAPVTQSARTNRIRGGGAGGCLIVTGIIGVICIVGLAVGLGVGLRHHSNGSDGGDGNGDGNGGGGPSGGGVSGGPAGTALANANLASIPLFGCTSNDYNGEFIIGGQSFQLLIDSGSSTTAVAGSDCDGCGTTSAYKPGSGATNTGESAEATYGDQSGWRGTIYQDTIVGGASNSNATSPVTMDFVSIDEANSFFRAPNCAISGNSKTPVIQGILGVGPQDLTLPGTDDFVSKLSQVSGLPNAYTFTACDPNSKGSGFMTFGGYDPDFVSQDPEFVNLLDVGRTMPYYGVDVDSVGLGGTQVASNIGATIVDTGTSQLILPTNAFNSFMSTLSKNAVMKREFSEVLQGACSQPNLSRAEVDAQLPQLKIGIETGSGSVMTLTLAASNSYLIPLPSSADASTAGAYCLAVGDGGSGDFGALLGNTVMRGLSVVFDLGNQKVGFAPSKGCPVTLT